MLGDGVMFGVKITIWPIGGIWDKHLDPFIWGGSGGVIGGG